MLGQMLGPGAVAVAAPGWRSLFTLHPVAMTATSGWTVDVNMNQPAAEENAAVNAATRELPKGSIDLITEYLWIHQEHQINVTDHLYI